MLPRAVLKDVQSSVPVFWENKGPVLFPSKCYPPTAVGYPPTSGGYPPTAVGSSSTAIGYSPTAFGHPSAGFDGRLQFVPSCVAPGDPPWCCLCVCTPPPSLETQRTPDGFHSAMLSKPLPLFCPIHIDAERPETPHGHGVGRHWRTAGPAVDAYRWCPCGRYRLGTSLQSGFSMLEPHAAPAARTAARSSGHYRGTGETVPFVNRTFEWGAVFATFLSVLSLGPRLCARLTNFLHPKLRKIDAVLITPQLITLALRRAANISSPHHHCIALAQARAPSPHHHCIALAQAHAPSPSPLPRTSPSCRTRTT